MHLSRFIFLLVSKSVVANLNTLMLCCGQGAEQSYFKKKWSFFFLYGNVCIRRNNKTFRVKNESPLYPVYLWTHIELCNLNQHVRGSRVNNKGEKCHSNPFVETLNALNLSISSRNTECYSHELLLPPGGGEWSCF